MADSVHQGEQSVPSLLPAPEAIRRPFVGELPKRYTRKLPSLEREWVVGQSLRPCLSNSLVQPFIQRNSSVSMNPTKPIHCIAEKTGFDRDGDSALQPVRAFAPVAERSAYVPRSFMIQFQVNQTAAETPPNSGCGARARRYPISNNLPCPFRPCPLHIRVRPQ